MRLDKYLKVSRLVKRRTVANEICAAGRAFLNGKPAKPGAEVRPGDRITLLFGTGATTVEVLAIRETVRKEEANSLYRIQEGGLPPVV